MISSKTIQQLREMGKWLLLLQMVLKVAICLLVGKISGLIEDRLDRFIPFYTHAGDRFGNHWLGMVGLKTIGKTVLYYSLPL